MRQRRFAMNRPPRSGGFSLIELMVVVAVVGILVAVALFAYDSHLIRTHRLEAKSALVALMARQENYRLVQNTFTGDLDALGFPGGCVDHNCIYTISFTDAPDTHGYTARAVPTPGGGTNGVDQTRDSDCQWFTIDERGIRGAGPGDNCW